jgi:riboflavin biosynthesis pyrimidine reductase
VEAGPTLREEWLKSGLWDESVVITEGNQDDEVRVEFREELPLPSSAEAGES